MSAQDDDALTPTGRFVVYASAFEKAFATDDWSAVAECLHEDIVYEVPFDPPLGGRYEGRAAVLAYMKDILDRLDRCFEARVPELLEMPREDGDTVSFRGRVRYTSEGVPDLVFELDETLRFRDGRIVELTDDYDSETRRDILDYIEAHGRVLGIRARA
jgi:ketosteroid isomerase-like protein